MEDRTAGIAGADALAAVARAAGLVVAMESRTTAPLFFEDGQLMLAPVFSVKVTVTAPVPKGTFPAQAARLHRLRLVAHWSEQREAGHRARFLDASYTPYEGRGRKTSRSATARGYLDMLKAAYADILNECV